MIDPRSKADVDAELQGVIDGRFEKVGEYWRAPSGRRYGRHDDALFPVDGPGIVRFDRKQHQLTKEMNNRGIDGARRMADGMIERGELTAEQVEQVREMLRRCER